MMQGVFDIVTVTDWLTRFGLSVEPGDRPGVAELQVSTGGPRGSLTVAIKPAGRSTWSVIHERRIDASDLQTLWSARDSVATPLATLAQATTQLACGFPLVRSDLHEAGDDCILTLQAPVYEENLAPQSLLLTVSAVLKAAEAFDYLSAARAEAAGLWQEHAPRSTGLFDNREDVGQSLDSAEIRSTTTTPASEGPTGPTVLPVWTPTHIAPGGGLHAWAAPDGSQPPIATLQPGVELRVMESRGAWARVVAYNGWEGWVDGRLLAAARP